MVPELLVFAFVLILESSLALLACKNWHKFCLANEAIIIFVKNIERNTKIFCAQEASPINRSRDELCIINFAIVIGVQLGY